MKSIGFWANYPNEKSLPGLPWPVPSEKPWADKALFLEKLKKLQDSLHGPLYRLSYRGFSMCRCCNKSNGSVTFKYNDFTWPSGYAHYVDVHNVRPDPDFEKWIMELP